VLLCEFQRDNPELRVELSVSDTQSVVELVADRRLELGIVGARAAPPLGHIRAVLRDEVILACLPGTRSRGRRSTSTTCRRGR
jgi:DNA-binding transcriptional LysR family regulator